MLEEKTGLARFALPLVLLLVALTNLNVPDNEFLNWDDTLLVTANPRVQMDSLSDLGRIFDPREALGGGHLEWIPLRDAVYGLIFYGFGLEPAPYHLVQILAHALVVVLVFFLARGWVGERAAAIAAALFAVHPIHVESVAWIAALKDPTFTAALLLAIALWRRSVATGRLGWHAGALGMMVVALGFKQIAIVLPALLLLVDWAFQRRPLRELVLDKIPFALIGFVALTLFVAIGRQNSVIVAPPGGSAGSGFLTMTTVYAAYLGKLAWPWDLSARYLVTPVSSPFEARFVVAALVIAASWAAAIAVSKRTRLPLFALGWFTIGLLPVMNIVPIPIEMADRYLYLPSVGVLIAAGAGIAALLERRPLLQARAAAVAASLVVLAWAGGSLARNRVWQDDVTLWRSVVERSPEFYIGRTNLASALLARGDRAAAERGLRAAIATNPRHATALLNLGALLRDQGRPREARQALEQAIAARPDYPKAYNNLAALLMDRQQWAEARPVLERALALDPEHPSALRNLAIACARLRDDSCAVQSMRKAIEARPASRGLFLEWLALLDSLGRGGQALADRGRVERFFRADAEVWERFNRVTSAR